MPPNIDLEEAIRRGYLIKPNPVWRQIPMDEVRLHHRMTQPVYRPIIDVEAYQTKLELPFYRAPRWGAAGLVVLTIVLGALTLHEWSRPLGSVSAAGFVFAISGAVAALFACGWCLGLRVLLWGLLVAALGYVLYLGFTEAWSSADPAPSNEITTWTRDR